MAVTRLPSYDTGYEDERFEQIVSETLHCVICTNVIKNPAMCDNEHMFCKACITRHLMYSQTCPTCMQPLTVEMLKEPSRTVMNLLAELRIRCEFFDRGCEEFVELENLERHVADCGFAPAICSNEGCLLEVNKKDLLHHETVVCEHLQAECQGCNDMRREMGRMKTILETLNETLTRNEKSFKESMKRNENVKEVMCNFVAGMKLVEEQLNKQEESNRQFKEDNLEVKKTLNEMAKQLERMTQQTSLEVKAGNMQEEISESYEVHRKPRCVNIAELNAKVVMTSIVVVGGKHRHVLNSVEIFSLWDKTWTPLRKMREGRMGASAFVYNNQIFISGGYTGTSRVKSIEKLSVNAVHFDLSTLRENFPAELPGKLVGHCSVVYNGRLIVIGGYDGTKGEYSDSITEISLVPPYTSKLLAIMPQSRCYHGVAVFGDKILIVGGRRRGSCESSLGSVVMYDITKNEWQKLAPLPYPVHEMATVKWGDDSVIIMGGGDTYGKPLNKVFMYNIKTQKIQMLPGMKHKRKVCVSAVVRDTVIVMGGYDGSNYLKSVESFIFDRYSWEELQEMHEARSCAAAVVC